MIVEAVSQGTMIHFDKHIVRATRLLITLFIVANSGFTTVIRQCTMEPAHSMECCAASGEYDSSPQKGSYPRGETTVIGVAPQCHLSTVVGGLANVPALLEKEHPARSASVVSSTPLFCNPIFFVTNSKQSAQFFNLLPVFSPRSVEKCVLNSTFLI